MKNTLNKLGLLTLSLALVVGCAKERPINERKIDDRETERLSKAVFTGSSAERSTWFHKVTVTQVSNNGGFLFVGLQSDMKAGYFEFTKDKLKFFDISSPYEKATDSTSLPIINQWSISHTDVELAETDGKTTNREEEADDKKWNEKRFFNVDFSRSDFSESAVLPYYIDFGTEFGACWNKTASRLVDNSVELSADYVGYVVEVQYKANPLCLTLRRAIKADQTFTAQFRFSYKRITPSDYKPMFYKNENDPLQKKFGYFQTVVEAIHPKTGLIDKKIVANRWHPDKTHDIYFAKDFPEKWKWLFNDPKTGIIARTNALFEKQGLKIRFAIRENTHGNGKTKEFGDLRYSFIKIVDELDPSAPLGYGPSDANPFTGEIIAANTVLWTGYLKYYIELLDTVFKNQDGKFEKSSLYKKMKLHLGEDPTKWTLAMPEGSAHGKVFREMLPNFTFGYPGWARFSQNQGPVTFEAFVDKGDLATQKVSLHQPGLELLSPMPKMMKSEQLNGTGLKPFMPRPLDSYGQFVKNQESQEMLAEAFKVMDQFQDRSQKQIAYQKAGHCVMEVEPNLISGREMILNGATAEEALNTIMYRVAIHEFGHNLNLRHNFYGSVDRENFDAPLVKKDKDGVEKSYPAISASVMDYLNIKDEIHLHHDWESYDRAALVYAYSGGKKDISQNHLFCTDEHTILNALCNHWDRGTSPSEIAMSMIEEYDDRYFTRNLRWVRPYWDASDYAQRVFGTMMKMKKFLPMWRSGMPEEELKRQIALQYKNLDKATRDEIVYRILKDFKTAINLSMAFYDAVIQQSAADRHYRSEYEEFNGELKRIGIAYDKLFAMLFLAGDDALMYNPNRQLLYSSYLTFRSDAVLGPTIERILENTVTERVDMEPWFIDFARTLYALNAVNYANMDDSSLIEKIRVSKYSAEDMERYFNLSPNQLKGVDVLTLEKAGGGYFREQETVAVVQINKNYYMISKDRNPYSYDIVKKLIQAIELDDSTVEGKSDLLNLYSLYNYVIGDQP